MTPPLKKAPARSWDFACAASAGVSGICPRKSASADRPGPGFCVSKIGKALEGVGVSGICPVE